MPDKVTLQVQGLKELDRKLREFGPKLARRALRSAVNSGAQVIKKEAQRRAPVDTGRLSRKAIFVKRIKEFASNTKESYTIGVRLGRKAAKKDRDAYYWWFLEFGTRFVAAMPFLRPSFRAKNAEALEQMKKKLSENIQKITNEK